MKENLVQHSLGKYKHKAKDININNSENLQEKVDETNTTFSNFNTRLLALEA